MYQAFVKVTNTRHLLRCFRRNAGFLPCPFSKFKSLRQNRTTPRAWGGGFLSVQAWEITPCRILWAAPPLPHLALVHQLYQA